MAEGTYEYECMRAELLGIEKPNEEEFEKARAERLKREQEELETAEAALLEQQEDQMRNVGGRLDELNTILSSTQQKLNRFKQTACGSLSNIFARGSVDLPDGTPSTSATASRRNTTATGGSISGQHNDEKNDSDTNSTQDLDNVRDQEFEGETKPIIPTEKIRAAKMDIQKKMTSHLDKLDSLINKADNAEISMSEQTKQMSRMAK
ncbi:uncharacterized protein LOC126759783 [Bactrocera neohumeralis]|uniref:uncharacterized protein LOC120774067 n=1 Tax=Bactrocera tryoni TaxID=59916 RepID=UPI001A980A52|nr:uncharacterized protein LOC120774067 [Bactrocera tryoni]XP_050330849.1 uncharacterized protein LOC126759783 [Bactrocera neohumeralis]